jgi:transcriptional regulator with XRE-family HTH domain
MRELIIDFEKLKGAVWGKQPKIAAALGIKPSTLSSKINKKIRLHLDELNIIARTLGRDTTDFVHEVEVESEQESE